MEGVELDGILGIFYTCLAGLFYHMGNTDFLANNYKDCIQECVCDRSDIYHSPYRLFGACSSFASEPSEKEIVGMAGYWNQLSIPDFYVDRKVQRRAILLPTYKKQENQLFAHGNKAHTF